MCGGARPAEAGGLILCLCECPPDRGGPMVAWHFVCIGWVRIGYLEDSTVADGVAHRPETGGTAVAMLVWHDATSCGGHLQVGKALGDTAPRFIQEQQKAVALRAEADAMKVWHHSQFDLSLIGTEIN